MEKIPTYKSRFVPILPTREVKTFIVPIQWYRFENDRLDGRGPSILTKAKVEVRAQDEAEALKFVRREWRSWVQFGKPEEAK